MFLLPWLPTPAPPIDPATGKSWVEPGVQNKAGDSNSDQNELHSIFKAWFLEQMRLSGNHLKERMVYWLHTHLPTRWTVVNNSESIYYQNALYRYYALGNFKELFKK
ncbi:MAG: DUF1800 domain-containing protein [Bacteroidales bacterium]|nr:DUF1800 domain-containing protein [Bacteroidales bacterium]